MKSPTRLVIIASLSLPLMAQLPIERDPGPNPYGEDWFYFPTPSGEFTFALQDGAMLSPKTEAAVEYGFADAARRLGIWWISPGSFVFVAHPVQIWEPATGFWSERNGFYVGGYFEYDSIYWRYGEPEIHFTADNWDYWRVRALVDHESAHALCWAAGGPNWREIGHDPDGLGPHSEVTTCW